MAETLVPPSTEESLASSEKLQAAEFRQIVEAYGLDGGTPLERAEKLKQASDESIALFLSDVNRRLQGSSGTAVSEKAVSVGEKDMVAPEHRYDLFTKLTNGIRQSKDINPARLGDALGLGTVILHPFKDGNGRTARLMALLYREDYDASDYHDTFGKVAKSRDEGRANNEFVLNGLIPYFPEGADQSDPAVVSEYFESILNQEEGRLYTGPAGQAPLRPEVKT